MWPLQLTKKRKGQCSLNTRKAILWVEGCQLPMPGAAEKICSGKLEWVELRLCSKTGKKSTPTCSVSKRRGLWLFPCEWFRVKYYRYWWWRILYCMQRLISDSSYLEDFGHLALLRQGAVVLYGQDDGHVGVDERGPADCLHHILEDHGIGLSLRDGKERQIRRAFSKIHICLTRLSNIIISRQSREWFRSVSNLEGYLCGEGVSVVDHRHSIVSIPAVQFNTSAALQQHLGSHDNQQYYYIHSTNRVAGPRNTWNNTKTR